MLMIPCLEFKVETHPFLSPGFQGYPLALYGLLEEGVCTVKNDNLFGHSNLFSHHPKSELK